MRVECRILHPFRVHGVAGFTHALREALDALSELRETPFGHRVNRCRRSIDVPIAQAIEEISVVAAVVLHHIAERHAEGDGINAEFVGKVDQRECRIGVVDP